MAPNRPVILLAACLAMVARMHVAVADADGPPAVTQVGPVSANLPQSTSADPGAAPAATPQPKPETAAADDSSARYRKLEGQAIGGRSADSSGDDKPAASGGGFFSGWIALAAVLGLIVVAAWVVRRWAPAGVAGHRGGPMKVVARWPLSAKQHVVLMHLGRRLLVVGVTGQQISLLAQIDDPGEIEQLLAACPSGKSILGEGFAQLLGRQSKAMADADEEPTTPAGRGAGEQVRRLMGRVQSSLSKLKSFRRA
ncbi:MAG: hypothetical protein BIFFINMI_03023 [Phycisphaerae bacterium]|nr:hypothetical protein [Phycisphaerae bacterium]